MTDGAGELLLLGSQHVRTGDRLAQGLEDDAACRLEAIMQAAR